MTLPEAAEKAAGQFGRAVVRRKWADLSALFTASAQSVHTPDALEQAFGWKHLEPRLRRMHIDMTGESEDMVPVLDRPKRFEVFGVEGRAPPDGHDPAVPVTWMEVDFQPAEDSEFDVCYNLFLAFIDEGGPRVTAYAIESATE